jgi:glycosyltransferase involved in cell wall biosynthesis
LKRSEVPVGPRQESERVRTVDDPVRIAEGTGDRTGDRTLLILRPRQLHLPLLWPLLDPLGVILGLLGAAARQGRPDILHAHWLHPYGFAAAVVGKLMHRPVVITAHDDVVRLGLPGSAYYRRSMRVAVRHAASVICVSRAMASQLIELGAPPERVVVIPNGVDLARFRPRDRAACRGELKAFPLPHPPDKLMVFAGELGLVKQVDRLLRAFQLILSARAPRSSPLRLAIVGGGPEEGRLRALAGELGIADHVVFTGRRPHAEIPIWLAAADLLVLPSSSEGMPLVALESLAAGTPVVASRVGGVPECLVDGVSAILVDPAGVEPLAAGLGTALERDWDRESLTAAARPFGWDAVVARVEACYVAALAPARGLESPRTWL